MGNFSQRRKFPEISAKNSPKVWGNFGEILANFSHRFGSLSPRASPLAYGWRISLAPSCNGPGLAPGTHLLSQRAPQSMNLKVLKDLRQPSPCKKTARMWFELFSFRIRDRRGRTAMRFPGLEFPRSWAEPSRAERTKKVKVFLEHFWVFFRYL